MNNVDFNHIYRLSEDVINRFSEGIIGNYALYISRNNQYYVAYIGRSTDLKRRLREHLGERYSYFAYCFQNNERDAYKEECRLFHLYGGTEKLDNDIHPAKYDGRSHCPYCGQ